MQETAKTLQPANDLPGVRVQIASMKVIKTTNTSTLKGEQCHEKNRLSTFNFNQGLFEKKDLDSYNSRYLVLFSEYNILLKLICDFIYSRIRNEVYLTKIIYQRSWQNSSNFYADMFLYYTYTRVKFA